MPDYELNTAHRDAVESEMNEYGKQQRELFEKQYSAYKRTKKAKQSQSNTEFVAELMEFSRYGALSQLFVIEAIRRYAEEVAKAEPVDSGLISGVAWKAVAEDIQTQLKAKYGF